MASLPQLNLLPPAKRMPDADDAEKKKRKPGRRPQAVRAESLTITLPPADMERLRVQALVTGHHRSVLLRRAWQGLPLTPKVKWNVQVVDFYKELVKLVEHLETIAVTEQFGPAVQQRATDALDQVQRFMHTLNEGEAQ